MELLTELLPVLKSGPGIPGHGEGLLIDGRAYYYACETEIPRDRVVSLVREGNTRKDRSWVIVAYDADRGGFVLVERVDRDLMHCLIKYRGAVLSDLLKV